MCTHPVATSCDDFNIFQFGSRPLPEPGWYKHGWIACVAINWVTMPQHISVMDMLPTYICWSLRTYLHKHSISVFSWPAHQLIVDVRKLEWSKLPSLRYGMELVFEQGPREIWARRHLKHHLRPGFIWVAPKLPSSVFICSWGRLLARISQSIR